MTYWYLLALVPVFAVLSVVCFRLVDDAMGSGIAEAVGVVGSVLFAFSAVVSAGMYGGSEYDRATCYEQGRQTGVAVEYKFLSGCYVTVDDHLVPYDRWVQVTGVNAP